MTHSIAIKRRSQRTTAEDYTRPFILLSFQIIFSHSIDIFGTRCRLDVQHPSDAQPTAPGLNRSAIRSISVYDIFDALRISMVWGGAVLAA